MRATAVASASASTSRDRYDATRRRAADVRLEELDRSSAELVGVLLESVRGIDDGDRRSLVAEAIEEGSMDLRHRRGRLARAHDREDPRRGHAKNPSVVAPCITTASSSGRWAWMSWWPMNQQTRTFGMASARAVDVGVLSSCRVGVARVAIDRDEEDRDGQAPKAVRRVVIPKPAQDLDVAVEGEPGRDGAVGTLFEVAESAADA